MTLFAKWIGPALEVYMDASTVGSRSTELKWLWSPDIGQGGWGPPLVPNSAVQPAAVISILISSVADV